MRILVVGAGAIGGYFGGRLLAAGRDVTFLVRPRRAGELARTGLNIRSRFGDVHVNAVPSLTKDGLSEAFDLVLLSCKAYDLDDAMAALAPAVAGETAILPLLNGMAHLDILAARFGAGRVLGGQCAVSTMLDPDGRVVHLNDTHTLTFGEQRAPRSARVEAIASEFSGAGFEAHLSEAILQEMWEKWVAIATAAGITCLMRAPIGDIVTAGAADLVTALFDECGAIATAQGFPPRPTFVTRMRQMFTAPGSPFTTSMLRDIERAAPTEADNILGDLLRYRGAMADDRSLLRIAYAHAKAYEARRTGYPAVIAKGGVGPGDARGGTLAILRREQGGPPRREVIAASGKTEVQSPGG